MSEVNAAFEKWHDEFYGPQDKFAGIRSLERFPEESGLGDSYLDSTVCAQFTAFKAAQSELAALREELADSKAKRCAFLLEATDGLDRLKLKFKAAEQRNSELVKSIESINASASTAHVSQSLWKLKTVMASIARITGAALKPTESGASE